MSCMASGTVKAVTNLAIREYGLAYPNVFANIFIPDYEPPA